MGVADVEVTPPLVFELGQTEYKSTGETTNQPNGILHFIFVKIRVATVDDSTRVEKMSHV